MNKVAAIHPSRNSIKSVIRELGSETVLPFTEVLTSESINEHISSIRCRNRIYTPAMTLFGFLSQAIGADQSCQSAVSKILAYMIGQKSRALPSSNTSAYCKARARLPEQVLSGLTKKSGRQLEEHADAKWLWRGRHVKMVDGSTITMPDTAENQKAYPQPNTQKKDLVFL